MNGHDGAMNMTVGGMLSGVILLWFILTALSVLFVAVDIRRTPESPVLKWAFVLITAYTGPIGAFLYVLGCREPLPGLHERYVAARWRQTLGSTMHCVAGDGVGILVGAVIASFLGLSQGAHVVMEYVLGFGFGWSVFQAGFMRDMAGGSWRRALAETFVPELLSMNALMGGMVLVMTIAMAAAPGSHDPRSAAFWFVMSMALLAGALVAYPINWWLVAGGLKHGMMTIRPEMDAGSPMTPGHGAHQKSAMPAMVHETASDAGLKHGGVTGEKPSSGSVAGMTVLSFAIFIAGLAVAWLSGTL